MTGIAGRTAIAGVGATAFGKLPGRSAWSLQAEAVRLALEDAGLHKDDVDGLLTEPQFGEPLMLHGHILGRSRRELVWVRLLLRAVAVWRLDIVCKPSAVPVRLFARPAAPARLLPVWLWHDVQCCRAVVAECGL